MPRDRKSRRKLLKTPATVEFHQLHSLFHVDHFNERANIHYWNAAFFLSGKSLWYSADQMPDCCRCFPFGQLQFFNAVFQDLINGGILLHLKETGAIKGGSNKVDLTVRTDETSLRVPHISLDCHGTPRSGFKRCFLSWMRKINPIIQMQMEFWNLAIFSWAMRGLAAMLNLVSFLCRDWSQRYSGVATYRHSWNCKPPRGVPGDAYQTHLCSDVKKKMMSLALLLPAVKT